MRVDGGRKKKLTAAFHFQFANQAGWECGGCRRAGLEKRRRCGWMSGAKGGSERVVWARKDVALTECPRSYISAESLAWVEEYLVRRRLGEVRVEELSAREAEAFLILEHEMAAERDGRDHSEEL